MVKKEVVDNFSLMSLIIPKGYIYSILKVQNEKTQNKIHIMDVITVTKIITFNQYSNLIDIDIKSNTL